MMRSCFMAVGLIAAALSFACGSAAEDPGAVQFEPTAPPMQAAQAGTPVSSALPVAAPQPPAAANPASAPLGAVAGSSAAAPESPAADGVGGTTAPRADMPSTSGMAPASAAGSSAASGEGSGVDVATSFDAGSGTMQPDGKTVVYRIPDGTGGNDWNDKAEPIRVERGMTLRLIDDDKSTKAGGHWLHTYGQPCPHSTRAIGEGYDCVISQKAPVGVVSGVAEHNIRNGIGHLYIEVVAE